MRRLLVILATLLAFVLLARPITMPVRSASLALTTTPTMPHVNLPLLADAQPTTTPTVTSTSIPTQSPSPTRTQEPLTGVINGDFEQGSSVGWLDEGGYITNVSPDVTPYSGQFLARLPDSPTGPTISQDIVPLPQSPYLTYWMYIVSTEQVCGLDRGGVATYYQDTLIVLDSVNLCMATANTQWVRRSIDLTAYINKQVSLEALTGTFDTVSNSTLYVDFFSLSAIP